MPSPTADNILQQVQTYQMSNLAYLQNLNCFISTANTRFKDFDKIEANLGSSVSFDLPPRFVTANSLVATFQPAAQRIHTLSVNNAYNTSYVFSAEQFIFNVRDYMEKFGKAATVELGAQIEANVAGNCETGPYRFYGNGVAQINSFQQLAQALAMFRNYGSPTTNLTGYISDLTVPSIIGSGLQQFALTRNNETANSWELGKFSNCEWYTSNLLPIHTSGTEGVQASVLTVVSTTLNAANQVTAITFSGTNAANDASSVKKYDRFQFNDGVAGRTNLRYLTWTGHKPSGNPVQFQATADATSTAGSQVTVSIYPPLQATVGAEQNLNTQIVAGMQVSVLPSHRVGMITGGNPLFLAMPRLPEEVPFPTSSKTDPDTGVSMRMYYGSKFGENQRGMIHDVIWGSTLVPEYAMAVVFPL
jgi:hypothetical protein